MHNIKGLFFDVGGTVFDWKNTAKEHIRIQSIAHKQDIDSDSFANDWRSEMFRIHTQVRHGNLPWMNSDDMHLKALENLSTKYPLLKQIDRAKLVRTTWHNLNVFPGAATAIERLRTKYSVVVLTVLSFESIINSSKRAGVQWDGIISCEFLGYYKPSLQAYAKGIKLLGLAPAEAMMVAAHTGDLAAASQAGMHTAYVTVPEDDKVFEGLGETENFSFDIEASDFNSLCDQLGV